MVDLELDFLKTEKALAKLKQILAKPMEEDGSNIDASIQRFEFTIELIWKLLKKILFSKGVIVQYPRDVLKESYAGGLIDNEDIWLAMLKDRNLTSHTYEEKLAAEIFSRLSKYYPIMYETITRLKIQISTNPDN